MLTRFSAGDGDVGRTARVEHSIPVKEGAQLVRLPRHRLELETKAEADTSTRLVEEKDDQASGWYLELSHGVNEKERWHAVLLCRLQRAECLDTAKCVSSD